MFDQIILNRGTEQQIKLYLKIPSQGLLLYGEPASGKKTIAKIIASELLGVSTDNLATHPYYIEVNKPADKQTIDVETVRALRQKLHLTTTGKNWPGRVVIINNSELLGIESQNMLLKLLEEPPKDTVIILTNDNLLSLLATVRSRLQKISVMPISLKQSVEHYSGDYSEKETTSAWNLSGGASGLLHSLLNDDGDSKLKESVELAKKLITSSLFERMSMVDELSKDSKSITPLFEALLKVLAAVHSSSINKGSAASSAQILKKRQAVVRLQKNWQSGANTRLLLSSLMLSL